MGRNTNEPLSPLPPSFWLQMRSAKLSFFPPPTPTHTLQKCQFLSFPSLSLSPLFLSLHLTSTVAYPCPPTGLSGEKLHFYCLQLGRWKGENQLSLLLFFWNLRDVGKEEVRHLCSQAWGSRKRSSTCHLEYCSWGQRGMFKMVLAINHPCPRSTPIPLAKYGTFLFHAYDTSVGKCICWKDLPEEILKETGKICTRTPLCIIQQWCHEEIEKHPPPPTLICSQEETGLWGNTLRIGNTALGLASCLTCIIESDRFYGSLISSLTA